MPTEDQDKLLDENLGVVKVQAFQMKRCLDKGRLMDGLKHASTMLGELRTSLLSPKSYYELYMSVTDELRHLELFLVDEFEKGRGVGDLYELVQYAGNILPRLYLLITVGLVYIKTRPVLCRDILKDMVEMCRGVQHPLKGLFLRNYLLQCTRNILPDVTTSVDGGGVVEDSVEFVLGNFAEMNKLWVRMQHQGHSREKERREQERQDLRILVGTNLVRLSQLESIDLERYTNSVLPALLEQILSCRDAIAQEYLMESLVAVFPDEAHLVTLKPFLRACGELQPAVNVRRILAALVDRLAAHASRTQLPPDLRLFDVFSEQVARILESREMGAEDVVSLQGALAALALKVHPERMECIDGVLGHTDESLSRASLDKISSDSGVGKAVIALLTSVSESYSDLSTLLKLPSYPKLLSRLDISGQKTIALHLAENAVEAGKFLTTAEEADGALTLLTSLSGDELSGNEEFAEEQGLLGRFIHLLSSPSTEEQLRILLITRRHLGSGNGQRLALSLPPLVFGAFNVARDVYEKRSEDEGWEEKVIRALKFSHETIAAIVKAELAELPLRLFLTGALAIGKISFKDQETMAYEFISQAFSLYEEELSESKAQLAAILLIISTLQRLQCFGEENAEPLRTQCALAAAKLLKKPDQARAVSACAHLFWIEGGEKDSNRVGECLKKAKRAAAHCIDALVSAQLQTELLNTHLLFFERGCPAVTAENLQELLTEVKKQVKELEPGEEAEQLTRHLANTVAHIKGKKETDPDLYKGIDAGLLAI